MLLFHVNEDVFAIDSQYIVEIYPKISLKKMTPPHDLVAGLVNVGGKFVAVADMTEILSGKPTATLLHSRIVILSIHDAARGIQKRLAILVEKAVEVIEIGEESLHDAPTQDKSKPYLNGVLRVEGRSMQLLNVPALFHMLEDVLMESQVRKK